MRRSSWIVVVGLALATAPAAASAQSGRVSLEGRGGIAVPRGDLSDGGANSGFAAGLDLMYSLSPWLTGYVGASRDEFDGDFSSSGFQLGGKVIPGVYGSTTPWFNLGLLGQQMTVGSEESDMELGFEGGAGADFAISNRFSLSPAVRYRTYDAVFDDNTEFTARYFVLTLGAHLHLR
jgi:hypothetical protein